LPAVLALGLITGSCAMSGQLGGLFGGDKAERADITGSVKAPEDTAIAASALPPEADLAYARAAIADVLGSGGATTSAPWENPKTGARGTVTPIAAAYQQGDATCRDFLASYLHERIEAWLHGEACRAKKGRWEVKTLRPWKRS
jgi:hypothetical protein